MTDLLKLAERCEAATGPSIKLNNDIMIATGKSCHAPHGFSHSLDAAMTLVPEGYDWIIGRTNDGLTIHAEVGGRGGEYMRFGNTPELALCAASLRALAAAAFGGDVKQAPGEAPQSGPKGNAQGGVA